MLRKTLLTAIIAGLLVAASPALAQKKGPNGGMLAGKAGHETELVVSPAELTIYMIDDGKPHTTKGVNIRAVVQEGGKSTTITFTNIDNKKLVAKLATPLPKGAIVVVTGKDDHGDAISARYVIN
jgi:hypothetical protein